MNHGSKDMRMYARAGLRSAVEWTGLGRDVNDGAPARARADHDGGVVELFTRDQTHARPARVRPAAAAAPAPNPA